MLIGPSHAEIVRLISQGLQAARSADVAISQFRFLRKLLLVHGSWSYQRLSKLILCMSYSPVSRQDPLADATRRLFLQEHHVRPHAFLGKYRLLYFLRCVTDVVSTPGSMTFLVKSHSKAGQCRTTTSSSLFCLPWSLVFSTNTSRHVCSTDILSFISSDSRITSFPLIPSSIGSAMLSTIVSCVAQTPKVLKIWC